MPSGGTVAHLCFLDKNANVFLAKVQKCVPVCTLHAHVGMRVLQCVLRKFVCASIFVRVCSCAGVFKWVMVYACVHAHAVHDAQLCHTGAFVHMHVSVRACSCAHVSRWVCPHTCAPH